MFKRLFGKNLPPLTGAPTVRRLKTYSAQSGYVYQYYYQGRREAVRETKSGIEHVFDVTADRKTFHPVSVFLADESVESWEREHGRSLVPAERHAIAKMALFQAFDERDKPSEMTVEVRVRAADVTLILETLGVD